MKILLTAINAKYIHSNLAVYSLAAYAEENRNAVEIAEYTINHRREYILQEIYKKKPDVLCFSCYIWNYEYVCQIAAEFHKLRPEVPIWAGGPEVSYEIEKFFSEQAAFYGVMIGEGEESFKKLTGFYCRRDPADLSEIPGIAYRRSYFGAETDQIIRTLSGKPVNMDRIPFCYDHIEDFSHRIIYYESSRGCPFSCSYCLSSVDKHLRFRDLKLVKKDLLFFIEKEVPQVKFVDRTFNCNHKHAMAVWNFIQEQDRGKTNFHFEIAADLLTEEEIELLIKLRPGLVQLEIGVQSTHVKTIEAIHRTMQLSKIASAVRRIQKAGNIHMHLDLIAGLPYEDYERFQKSFREIYALQPNQLQLGFLKVLKGSYLYEHREEYGILYGNRPPYEVMQTKWISYDEILKIKLVEEMLEVYYNSGQFEVTMKLLDAAYPDSFGFFLELGQFYENNGYLDRSHSRIRRCELLLEFLQEEKKIPKEMIQESLLYDLYYRENMKSRPYWARNPAEFARISRVYCKKGKSSHIEPFFYRFPTKEQKNISGLPKRLEKEIYMLFDYEKRDALTHQACVTEIRDWEEI